MTSWTGTELTKIGNAEELDIQSLGADGTLRKPTTIWVVRVGDEVYVRAYRGRGGKWFRGIVERHVGHIRAGGVDKDVTFVEVSDEATNSQIDTAYRTKYRRHEAQYVDPMVAPAARAATLRLMPRG